MNILERMAANGSEERIASFCAMQQRDYDFKVAHAEETAYKFLEHPQINGMAYVAVGGLDSITLLCFLRSIGIELPAVSVSVLEDKSIQRVHKELGVTALKPLRSKVNVIKELGWPSCQRRLPERSVCCSIRPRRMPPSAMLLSRAKPESLAATGRIRA